MSKRCKKDLGIWIDIPSYSSRAFVPLGKSRLNALGLFYFKRHFSKAIAAEMEIDATLEFGRGRWKTLKCGRRIFFANTAPS